LIAFLDTSVLVPLLVDEPTTDACRQVWDAADELAASQLAYVEAAAALAQARRLRRLSAGSQRAALTGLNDLWSQVYIVDVDQPLAERAAQFADEFALRGYEAIQCASAEVLRDDQLIAATGDRRLLAAWHRLGIATYNTNSDAD
jgi:predicted nucleic acid-binding protein